MTSGRDEHIRIDAPEDAASIPALDHLHVGAADHLRAVAVASVRAGRRGPIAAYLDQAGRPRQLDLEGAGPDGWWIRAATQARGDTLPAVLLRGAAGLLPHALRSPLVRMDGSVTLVRRASRRGDTATLDDELARLAEVTQAALERADAHAHALHRLVERPPPAASPAAGDADPIVHVRAALERSCGPVTEPDTAWGPPGSPGSAAAGADAPGAQAVGASEPPVSATVVLPSTHPVPVPALSRLVAHLAEAWGVRWLRIVVPGHTEMRPVPDADNDRPPVDVARWWDEREDPDLPLALGRRWVGGDGSEVVVAVTDAAALVDAGVSVHLVPRADVPAWEQATCPRPWVVQLPVAVAGWQRPLDGGTEVVSLGRPDA